MDSVESDPLNRVAVGSEVSSSVPSDLPELPFPLPDIDGAIINSEFSLTPSQIVDGDRSSETSFSFDSSMFNDDLVNSAIWSIGGDGPLPNMGVDMLQDFESDEQSEFSGSDSGASLHMLSEDNEMIPPDSAVGTPKESNVQLMPPVDVTPSDGPLDPYKGVYCREDGFDDDFSPASSNPFIDASGNTIDPFFDIARDRALSTITEGDEDDDMRSVRSSSFNPSSFGSVHTAFADVHEFVRLSSGPKSQQCKVSSGWVNFDTLSTAETTISSSDRSNRNGTPPTPTAATGGGEGESSAGLLGTVESPVSDGNHVGVSPETVEGGLKKPVGNSWQSMSNDDDVVGGKTPSESQTDDQLETSSAKSSVFVSYMTGSTGDKINSSDAKFTANLEVPQSAERTSSPDSDASGEYMKLSDMNIDSAPSVPVRVESLRAKKACATKASSPQSTITNTALQGRAVSESTEGLHVTESDSHSDDVSKAGTGIGVTTGAVAAASSVAVNASTHGSTNDTSSTSGGENCGPKTPNQSSIGAESNTSAQSREQVHVEDNDPTSSSLDIGGRSRTSSNLDRGTRESNLDSSNLDAGSRAKKSRPTTPPSQQTASHPATNLPVLSPLSPDHGTELNQQYEFLRRTLSHSQRRYSQRRKQKGEQGRNGRDPSTIAAVGGPGGRRYTSSAGDGVESRRKQTVGQLKELLRDSGTPTVAGTANHSHEG